MHEDLIFDIGMHRGFDSEYYLKKGFRVVAVEADPIVAQKTGERLAQYVADKRLTILPVGIAEEAGTLDFYINHKQDDWSSFVPRYGQRGGAYETIKVKCVPLNDILDEFGTPYYLKVDIEGHDQAAIASLVNSDHRPQYVSVEATVPLFSHG